MLAESGWNRFLRKETQVCILDELRSEIAAKTEAGELSTDRRLNALNRLEGKVTEQVGHLPTDQDLHRLGRDGLMALQSNKAERNVAGAISRRLEGT